MGVHIGNDNNFKNTKIINNENNSNKNTDTKDNSLKTIVITVVVTVIATVIGGVILKFPLWDSFVDFIQTFGGG